jgi:hypothetical protein
MVLLLACQPNKKHTHVKQDNIEDLATHVDKVWNAHFLTSMDVSLAIDFNSNEPKLSSYNNLEVIRPIYLIPQ